MTILLIILSIVLVTLVIAAIVLNHYTKQQRAKLEFVQSLISDVINEIERD